MKIAIVFINMIMLISVNGELISNGVTVDLPSSFDSNLNLKEALYNDFLPLMVCTGTTLSANLHQDNYMYKLRTLALKFISCLNKMKTSIENKKRLKLSKIHHG